MAWRSHGRTNAELVANLERNELFKSPRVREAMMATDRGHFVPRSGNPYADAPQLIGHGATISAPHMHAECLEILKDHLVPGTSALDIGSGSGYLCAAFAHMVGPTGKVVGVEHIEELVHDSIGNLNALDPSLIASGRVKLVAGDGRAGYPAGAPFNAIHVGAAAPETPQTLLDQLAPGGRMVVPVGPAHDVQYLEQFDKDADGVVHNTTLMGVRYVPLSDRSKYS
eukprot:m.129565 g.129565  ORF g.129565 m.129565 type:complete len:226 (+) comp22329_c0_seq2:461-1138(+)